MIVLHIGTHKTGSSSLQHYLGRSRARLAAHGLAYYQGTILADNHIDLYLGALAPGRDSLAQHSLDLPPRPELIHRTREGLARFRQANPGKTLIYSSEGLSLLRSPSELGNLADLIAPDGEEVRVVMAYRDRDAFLDAYRRQILKTPGRQPSDNPQSALYVKADSWLADFDALRAAYIARFGQNALHQVDFDQEIARSGDVLPALLRAMSLPDPLIPAPLEAMRVNTSSPLNRFRQGAHKLLHLLRAG